MPLKVLVDGHLLRPFVERWHKETSSFYIPFCDMTITSNNVSSLFHIPLASSFFTVPLISQEVARMNVVHNLGVTEEKVTYEFRTMGDSHFHIPWLWDKYVDLVHQGMYEASARTYMLHLIGCPILADKSHVYINMKHMWLFTRLEHCN